MNFTSSNTAIVIAALIVAAGAYWYFFTGGEELPVTASTVVETPAQMQFRRLVSQLEPITFDTGIFSDVRFNALINLSTPINPETQGRTDPFAPLSGVSAR